MINSSVILRQNKNQYCQLSDCFSRFSVFDFDLSKNETSDKSNNFLCCYWRLLETMEIALSQVSSEWCHEPLPLSKALKISPTHRRRLLQMYQSCSDWYSGISIFFCKLFPWHCHTNIHQWTGYIWLTISVTSSPCPLCVSLYLAVFLLILIFSQNWCMYYGYKRIISHESILFAHCYPYNTFPYSLYNNYWQKSKYAS